ncbi:MAG: ASKHA domain-containing protein [Candidatus Bathyarchaeia archaeon]
MGQNKFFVRIEPEGVRVFCDRGTTVLEAINKGGLSVRSECGGRQVCGKCKIIIRSSGGCNELTESERLHLTTKEVTEGYRLACACKLFADSVVAIPEESRIGTRKVLIEGVEREVETEPYVRKVFLSLDGPNLSDVRSDCRRVLDSLREMYGVKSDRFDFIILSKLPETLRTSGWKVTLTISGDEIIDVEGGNTIDDAYGIAIDIGTSKIVGYLTDLKSGDLLETGFIENPQIDYGEDVISRVAYASKSNENLMRLHKLVVEGINRVISDLCVKAGCKRENIYEVTVVGNTAMHHLFLSLSPKFLGLSPYVPVISDSINAKAHTLSLDVNPSANIHILPVIAGFVGSDAVADIISTGIHKSDEVSMVVDVGTNTEVILGNKEFLTACSCASGPAFEGAHIKCGMKAVTGAIESVSIDSKTLEVKYRTIGGSTPIGLCGSGVIDSVAELFKLGIIDGRGRMIEQEVEKSRVRVTDEGNEFVLVNKGEGGAKRDIVITQKDVREVQLAKSAIYTGCYTLMKKIAGAFGNYLNPFSAKLIGMIPDIPIERMRFVGNAAGAGARMALISKKVREESVEVARKINYVELALDPNFQIEFASATYLPHMDSNRFPSLRAYLR